MTRALWAALQLNAALNAALSRSSRPALQNLLYLLLKLQGKLFLKLKGTLFLEDKDRLLPKVVEVTHPTVLLNLLNLLYLLLLPQWRPRQSFTL